MNKTIARLSLLLLLVTLIGCQPSDPEVIVIPASEYTPGPAPDTSNIAQNYPRVDGSTSTHPLQTLAACKILNATCSWINFLGNRMLLPDSSVTLQDAEMITGIDHTGTHEAYVNLIDSNTDFILVARLPSEDEIQAARAKGVKLEVHPVALDAFVFLKHKDNQLQSLTLEQIRGIYTGKFTNWSEVGGMDGKISAYQRDPNSGSQELMESLVMKGIPMIEAPNMMLPTMIGTLYAIRDDKLGIGYSVFYYVTFMEPDENIAMFSINGVEPTSETIARRGYPLVTEVYAVLRADMPSESPAVALRDWFLTEAGQQVVEESGYVRIR